MATTETRKMVLAAAAVCEDKKGEDTRVLELDPSDSGFTDFFVITSGTNDRQTTAIADEIEMRMKREFGTYANSVEGRKVGEWILLDYVDFVVHVFLAERRAFYDIERLRKSARQVDVDELTRALTQKTLAVRQKAPAPKAVAKTAVKTAAAPTAAAKKAAAKKLVVRTATKKSAPAKKAPAKAVVKASAKTTAAKPPAVKKAVATKSATSKTAVKKTAAKKVAAKKPAVKKATTKKASAKKA
jgi:ribosome-associated protein